ncbi:MAG: cation:proton antiporter [Holosporales bacterium]
MTEYHLISTIIGCIVAAAFLGYIAQKLKLPTLVGYLLAGVLIGPHTPGFVADVKLAKQLAEIGIILLMFGVGLHFSLNDLLRVRRVAVPGALFQMLAATLLGTLVGTVSGFPLEGSILFGLALSVASTVVLLRALGEQGLLDSEPGKLAVGWLIVEDIVMVLAIVLLPLTAEMLKAGTQMNAVVLLTEVFEILLKIGGFVGLMLLFGRRFLPTILQKVADTDSKELLTLCTLGIALGFAALAYSVFDASFALGAFFAGLVLNESDIGKETAKTTESLRDTFAVLFFVSVGMLFDPMTLINQPVLVLLTLAIIVFGKTLAALLITRLFRQDLKTSLVVSFSLAQIGEFSFILAGMGLVLNILSIELYNLILAGALLSIALNPLAFKVMRYWQGDIQKKTID